jgi:rod shape-determining protein MreD
MAALDVPKTVVLVFLAGILQVAIFSDVHVLGGRPDVLLLVLVSLALLRGPIFGATAGFGAGLLVDTANLSQSLGVSSLLLTLAGYWIGRYGESAGRDRTHAPFLSVAVVTFVYAFASLVLHFLLGEPAPARTVLLDTLFPNIFLNLLLTWPVYTLTRRLLPIQAPERAQGVQLLGN